MARITILSHWCKLIENLQTSPLGFYDLVEQAIRKREVPEVDSSRVEYHEGSILGAKREYLRVQRKNLAFDICGAPFAIVPEAQISRICVARHQLHFGFVIGEPVPSSQVLSPHFSQGVGFPSFLSQFSL